MTSMTALLLELERITPISVTTPVMHATMVGSIRELPPEIDFPSSGGIVRPCHKLIDGVRQQWVYARVLPGNDVFPAALLSIRINPMGCDYELAWSVHSEYRAFIKAFAWLKALKWLFVLQ